MAGQSPDRRVDKRATILGGGCRDAVGHQRIDGAHIHDQRAATAAGDNAGRPEHHVFHDRRIRQHRQHNIAGRGDFGGARCRVRAETLDLAHRLAIDVVDGELKALTAQIRGHRPAHAPEPDETNGGHQVLPSDRTHYTGSDWGLTGVRLQCVMP